MKLSEMKQALVAGNLRLTKSLGQNFLHDGNQLRRVVAAAELGEGDSVLEIGPGLGPLTELLLGKAGFVLAIEKDRRLFELLQQRLGSSRNLTLLQADALDYLQQQHSDWSKWKLVANLPYSVASPILVELAQAHGCPERLVATVQMEVAQRIVAQAGGADYGVLSLLLQLRYETRPWFKIPATCFFPPPDVDSACVTLLRRAQPLLAAAETVVFDQLVKRSFSQRRKMMLKLLKEHWPAPELEEAFAQIGLGRQERAEDVTLEKFVLLAQRLSVRLS
jgi:16S rRNA (adenine1518-N6/adenine1519-N6)-dimethyltransferase